jgi:hypothetical protein
VGLAPSHALVRGEGTRVSLGTRLRDYFAPPPNARTISEAEENA